MSSELIYKEMKLEAPTPTLHQTSIVARLLSGGAEAEANCYEYFYHRKDGI